MTGPPAGLRLRMLAFAIDYAVMAAYMILLGALSFLLRRGAVGQIIRTLFANPVSGQLTGFLVLTLPVVLYFALFECSAWQATVGKRRLGLQVVDATGGRLGLAQSLGRSVLKFLPWELTHTCLWRIEGWPTAPQDPTPIIWAGIGLVWIMIAAYVISLLASPSRQTLYDRLAGAFVILAPRHAKA